jgi:hypothetical protein
VTTRARLAALAIAAGLCGCREFQPFETVAAPGPPSDARPRVGLCYDALVSSAEAVQAAAQSACPPHSTAERVDTEYEMQVCPLLLPGHATFVCIPGR